MQNYVSIFRKFVGISNRLLTVISNSAMAMLVIVVALQIFGRYIFGVYFAWTEEASRYLMFWIVLLGAAKALQVNAHPKITFITEVVFKEKATYISRIFSSTVSIVFYVILIVYGLQFSIMNLTQLSLSLRIPMTFVFIAMPIGGFFLLLNAIIDILGDLGNLGVRSFKEGDTK